MRKLVKLWKNVSGYFLNMSLLRKLTLAYTIIILVPTVASGFYTYYQSMNNIKQELAQNEQRNILQIKEEIKRKIIIARGIGNNIAFNTNIQNLLYYGMDFTPEALNYFIESIAAPIDSALNFNDAKIYQIGVYFVNENVPEYNHFLNEKRISNLDWFKTFKQSDQDEMWLYPVGSKRFYAAGVDGITTVVRLVKKISSVDGKYLGSVMLDISEEDIFSSLDFNIKNYEIFAIDEKNRVVYPPQNQGSQTGTNAMRNINQASGYFFSNEVLYSYDTIEPLNIRIVSRTPVYNLMKNSALSSKYNILAVVLSIIVLEIFTYYLLKVIFSRLNQIVKIMGIVAKGNFNIRIPVISRDEVGLMAESFNTLIEKINGLINDVIRKETAHKDAQITALQYQINPHFIYNTIDIFRMKLELEGNYEMADSIMYFGKMLRYNINQNSHYATIKQEVDYIEKYITLQKLRYKERLKFEVDVPEELQNVKIIRFMLQPVVENSIKHGIIGDGQELSIKINFEKKSDRIEIQVIDNGRGMDTEELDRINHRLKTSRSMESKNTTDNSIGLENINTRIKLFYGEQYHITMESIQGQFTKAIINIPYVLD